MVNHDNVNDNEVDKNVDSYNNDNHNKGTDKDDNIIIDYANYDSNEQ